MAPITPLIARAEAAAKAFEYGPDEVRRGVKEFLRLMGKAPVLADGALD